MSDSSGAGERSAREREASLREPVVRGAQGRPYGSRETLEEIEKRSRRYLNTYQRWGIWTSWPRLHYHVDTSYLLGLLKASLSRLSELEAENKRLKEAAEHARLDLVFFGGLHAFDGEAPEETWKLDTSKVVARLDEVLENGQ